MELTERQVELVEFIRGYWTEWGYGPSLRDIAEGLLISQPVALEDVRRLADKGVLSYTPGVARSTRVNG